MGKNYNQLDLEERVKIGMLKAGGKSVREIGVLLGRSHSTIVGELKRNAYPLHNYDYLAHTADDMAEERKRKAGQRERLKSRKIRSFVRRKLRQDWSPELIAGWLRENRQDMYISHEAIYQYVHMDAPELKKHLIRGHRQRKRRGYSRKHTKSHIPNRTAITERPVQINNREEFGHWEADSVVSRKGKAALCVQAERKSRKIKITKLARKTAKLTRIAINRRLSRYPQRACLSITYDNGTENVEHETVNKTLGTKSYFCAPYRSWEKGTVENRIGLIRHYVPKKTDIGLLSNRDIKRIERRINNRPMKCLNYKTPNQVFAKLCGALAA
ncbi:MAG: IS30 family transposase [Nitrospinota bacterium]